MEPATRPEDDAATSAIISHVREGFGRLVYSHKTHEKTADIYLSRLTVIKVAQIVLSALTTGGLLVVLFGDPGASKLAAVVAAAISTLLLALNTYTKDFDLGQRAERHRDTAADLWRIRESYLSLIADLSGGLRSASEVAASRDELQEELGNIYAAAPRTLSTAYQKAGLALKGDEEFTFSDAEIDCFLPPGLRAGSKPQR